MTRRERIHLGYAVVIALIAMLAGYKGVLPVFRGHLRAYFAISDAGFGLLFSMGSLTGLAGVLFGGQAIDRWGPRRVIRVCLAGIGGSMLLLGLCGARYRMALIAFGVSGFFVAPFSIAVNAYLAKLFPRIPRRVISLNLVSSSMGGLMFPLIAEGLLQVAARRPAIPFAWILHIPLLVIGVALVCASRIYRPRGSAALSMMRDIRVKRWRWAELKLPPRAFFLSLMIAMHGLADGILFVWMPRYLESISSPDHPLAPGWVMSGYALAYLAARGVLALLPDRVGTRGFLVVPGLIGGGILAAGVASGHNVLTAIGYVFGAFCWSIEYPAFVSKLFQYERMRFGAAMAATGLLSGCLYVAAMNGVGLAFERVDQSRLWIIMLLPAAVFMLVGCGGLRWSLHYEPRRQQP